MYERGERMSVFILDNGVWKREFPEIDGEGNECFEYTFITITQVPVNDLLTAWEDLVMELSDKEVRLLQLKEYIAVKSFEIEQETDYKSLYGKNNADIRKQHLKNELGDVFDTVMELELSIGWIKSYIPLIKEVVRTKQ